MKKLVEQQIEANKKVKDQEAFNADEVFVLFTASAKKKQLMQENIDIAFDCQAYDYVSEEDRKFLSEAIETASSIISRAMRKRFLGVMQEFNGK